MLLLLSVDKCNGCGKHPCECNNVNSDYSFPSDHFYELPLSSKTFEAETLEEAKAKAIIFKGSVTEISREEFTQVKRQVVTGQGKTREQAMTLAQSKLPENAFNVGVPEIVQESKRGTVELREYTQKAARRRWSIEVPSGAELDSFTCIEKPKGFLWFKRSEGKWKAEWSIPFKVCIAYDVPASVTVWYR
jgi:hypothetical protein